MPGKIWIQNEFLKPELDLFVEPDEPSLCVHNWVNRPESMTRRKAAQIPLPVDRLTWVKERDVRTGHRPAQVYGYVTFLLYRYEVFIVDSKPQRVKTLYEAPMIARLGLSVALAELNRCREIVVKLTGEQAARDRDEIETAIDRCHKAIGTAVVDDATRALAAQNTHEKLDALAETDRSELNANSGDAISRAIRPIVLDALTLAESRLEQIER